MKILFLSNSIGGLRSFRYELISFLINRGDKVYISSPIESSPKCFEDLHCEIIPTQIESRSKNPINDIKLILNYRNIIKRINPDIILSYTIKPNIYGSVACRKFNVPIIANVTGLGVALIGNELLKTISIGLYRWGLKKTNFVYFQNTASLDFFKVNNITLNNYSLVAGSGVNLEKFRLTEYPKENGEIHFLFISRILKAKGVGIYLEAAEHIKKEYPFTFFHIVGIEDDKYYTNLVKEYDKKGIIIYHGQQNDVRPFISASNCLIHPSYYPEGISNVLLENAAMGRPSITTNNDGCKETVDDGISGYIAKKNDLEDLILKIKQFISLSYDAKKEMGIRAYNKVKDCFNRNDVVAEYVKRIDELVKTVK